jgi:hypothetical protein
MCNNNDRQLIFERINPEMDDKNKRKWYVGRDYLLNAKHGESRRLTIQISGDKAKEIISFYKTDKFQVAIDKHSGVIYLFPTNDKKSDLRMLYKDGTDAHYEVSITRKLKSERVFNVLGVFRRMFVVVALSEDHVLIVPDTKNEENEYEE